MTYGVEIYNSEGLKVVDFERTLYVRGSGTLVDGHSGYHLGAVAVDPDQTFRSTSGQLNFPAQTLYAAGSVAPFLSAIVTRFPWSGHHTIAGAGGFVTIPTSNLDPGDLIFVRIDSHGMLSQWNAFLDHPALGGNKGTSCINIENNQNPPFIHASPTPPPGTPTEGYGVQLFNSAGQSVFDSRQPIFSVRHAVLISGAALKNVVDTGTPLDIPLPKPIPGAYVAAPYFSSFFSVGVDRLWTAMLKQVADDMLRVTRVAPYDTPSPTGTTRSFTQELFILVGRPL